jgi:hypothetical protein
VWTHRPKLLEPKREILLPMRLRGRFRLSAIGRDGVTVRRQTRWIDNLITNTGLDLCASDNTPFPQCKVGTDNTAPAATDTALGAQVATTSTQTSVGRTVNGSSPFDNHSTVVYRFAQGAAEGNLAEVGVGTGDATLFSRALIVDGGGSPTTFPVAADEFLDVAYELIVYPPLVDDVDSITITGSGSHDTTLRASNLAWARGLYTGGGFIATADDGGSNNGINAYDGAIGAVTGSPAGSVDGGNNASDGAYTPGNFFRDTTWSFGLDDGNFAGGIQSVAVFWGNSQPVSVAERQSMEFQCEFDPAIPKDNTAQLSLVFRLAWARTT